MFPKLYSKYSISFSGPKNKIGVLKDAITCEVTEERNGAYELKLIYPLSGIHADKIEIGTFIEAKANDFSEHLQLFRVYAIDKDLGDKFTVSAEHISYMLNGFIVKNGNHTGTPGMIFNAINSSWITIANASLVSHDYSFSFETDFETSGTITVDQPSSIRAILGGSEGSLLDHWHGEYEFDNFNIKFLKNRGKDRGVIVSYGKNLTDLSLDNNDNSCYSHVFPYAAVQEEGSENMTIVYAKNGWTENTGSFTPQILPLFSDPSDGDCIITRVKILDTTSMFSDSEALNPQTVYNKASSYVSNRRTEIGKYTESLDVVYQPFGGGYGVPDMVFVDSVSLCDTMTVVYPRLNIRKSLKVNKTVYNVILEQYKSVSIGTPKSSFASTIKNEV